MARIIEAETHGPGGAPASGAPSTPWMLFAVFGAPAAWGLQLSGNAALACWTCARRGTFESKVPIGMNGEAIVLYALNIAALLVAIVAGLTAWRIMRARSGHAPPAERLGLRTRFDRTGYLALWGVLNGVLFTAALVFDLAFVIGAPETC